MIRARFARRSRRSDRRSAPRPARPSCVASSRTRRTAPDILPLGDRRRRRIDRHGGGCARAARTAGPDPDRASETSTCPERRRVTRRGQRGRDGLSRIVRYRSRRASTPRRCSRMRTAASRGGGVGGGSDGGRRQRRASGRVGRRGSGGGVGAAGRRAKGASDGGRRPDGRGRRRRRRSSGSRAFGRAAGRARRRRAATATPPPPARPEARSGDAKRAQRARPTFAATISRSCPEDASAESSLRSPTRPARRRRARSRRRPCAARR